MDRQKLLRILFFTILGLVGTILALTLFQQLLAPLIVYCAPSLEPTFYDLGFLGAYRTQSYVSFNLSSPHASIVQWDDSCDDGYIFLDPSGPSVDHRGPMILDAMGNLVWTSDQFETTTNLKVQRYRGQEYLTFWSGHKAKTMGTGSYYMLNSEYRTVHKVDAVGAGLRGDLHEFKITKDDTALLTVYTLANADLTGMGSFRTEHGWIVDNLFQEVDIASGRLLFEWRASDHFNPEDSYMTNPFGGYVSSIPFDFFHINSIDKDADGNYLISSRHMHSVMCIDGSTGEVLWELGGHSEDFDDLSDGKASSFSWQHDARWLSEEEGLLSLFDNGVAWPHVDAPYSQGLVIQLDVENHTAALLHSYISPTHPRSSSQGSVQLLPGNNGEPHVFIGWGSSAQYSEFTIDGELLCETHFAAPAFFWWERVKSYRAFKSLTWHATPAEWDPCAQIEDGKLYVSWNGATEVASWELQGRHSNINGEGDWKEVDVAERLGFEQNFVLPSGPDAHAHYRVAALDIDRIVLRYSNVAARPRGGATGYVLAVISAIVCMAAVVGFYLYRKRGLHVDWRRYAQYTIDRTKYRKV